MPASRAPLAKPRLEMDIGQGGAPLAVFAGRYSYSHARPALDEHAHHDALEICYLVKGRQTYRVQGRDYRLSGGDVFVTLPDEQHSTGGAPEEKGVLYWLVVRPPPRSRRVEMTLWRALSRLPARHFAGSGRMKEMLDALTLAFFAEGPLREATLHHLVTGFLLEVIACSAAPSGRQRSLEKVLRHIAEHLDEPATVPQLAALARLSTPHFKARFKEEMGIPPAEYQLRARVEEARRRLGTGRHSVTDIAFDLGFSSSQYFATVYKRFTGENPGAGLTRRPKNR